MDLFLEWPRHNNLTQLFWDNYETTTNVNLSGQHHISKPSLNTWVFRHLSSSKILYFIFLQKTSRWTTLRPLVCKLTNRLDCLLSKAVHWKWKSSELASRRRKHKAETKTIATTNYNHSVLTKFGSTTIINNYSGEGCSAELN